FFFRGFASGLPLQEWLQEVWKIEDKLTSEDIYWGTMSSILEMTKAGTTTFADMYFFEDAVAEAVKETGIRASLSRGIIGNAPNGANSLKENIELFDKYNGAFDDRITVMIGPHAPYTCNLDFLKEVSQVAKSKNIPIHMHISETRKEAEDFLQENSKTIIEKLEEIGFLENHILAAHCVHLSEEEIKIIKNYNFFVATNIESNLKLGSGIAPLKSFKENGVCISIGTDGVCSNNNLEMWSAMRFTGYVQNGLHEDPTLFNSYELLKMATINGAKALRIDQKVGTLEKGKEADIIVVDIDKIHAKPIFNPIDHLVYSIHPDDVDTVFIQGKKVLEKGKFTFLDESKILSEMERCRKRLFS
ncbi:MAG: amidohydrolase, partial [Candidatus Gracilibacteria bacterium]|nr:amidohydrolase [Candidatus Gracilibacteria bacterium]